MCHAISLVPISRSWHPEWESTRYNTPGWKSQFLLALTALVTFVILSFSLSLLWLKICNHLLFIDTCRRRVFSFEPFLDSGFRLLHRSNKRPCSFLLSFCCSFQLLKKRKQSRAYRAYQVLVRVERVRPVAFAAVFLVLLSRVISKNTLPIPIEGRSKEMIHKCSSQSKWMRFGWNRGSPDFPVWRDYSAGQILKTLQTFRGCWAGGNGVYTFFLSFSFLISFFASIAFATRPATVRASAFACNFSFFLAVFSEVLRWCLRNWGRKRSQDSFVSLGSLASSLLIMSSWRANYNGTLQASERRNVLLFDR